MSEAATITSPFSQCYSSRLRVENNGPFTRPEHALHAGKHFFLHNFYLLARSEKDLQCMVHDLTDVMYPEGYAWKPESLAYTCLQCLREMASQ